MAETDKYILKACKKMIDELNNIRGNNAKAEAMAKYDDLKPLILRIWRQNDTTGITIKKLDEWQKDHEADSYEAWSPMKIYEVYDALVQRRLTGHRAKAVIWQLIDMYPKYEAVLKAIFAKDLRLGMGLVTVSKIFPGLLENFKKQVALAERYTDLIMEKYLKQYADEDPSAYLSVKLDGVRLITEVGTEIKFQSREGNQFTSLNVLESEMRNVHTLAKKLWPDKELVCDGELAVFDENGRENFKKAVGDIKRKSVQMENPMYEMFDLLWKDEFYDIKDKSKEHVSEVLGVRFARLHKLWDAYLDKWGKPKYWHVLAQIPWSWENFKMMKEEARKKEYEGLMIRFNARYKPGRSYDLLKYKLFETEEFKVRDLILDDAYPMRNKQGGEDLVPALSAVIIWLKDDKKNTVRVGSGFSKEERMLYYQHPEKIKGKIISVQYQEEFYDETEKKFSLRIPTFKGLHGAKRDT
jgi:DNA ligase-1